jgi:hypothetical protein
MAQFILILHNSTTARPNRSPAEAQAITQRYVAWSQQLGAKGHIKGGQKLKDEPGKVVTLPSGKMTVRDGPFSETKEIIGGYFLMEAKDYSEASALCDGCPHLEFGGTIEVREIDAM